MSNTTIIIDDEDSRVVKHGTWPIGGTSHEYDNTVTGSTNVGDSLSLEFTGDYPFASFMTDRKNSRFFVFRYRNRGLWDV